MDQEKVEILNQLNQHHEVLIEQLKIVEQQISEIGTFDEELNIIKSQKDAEILAPLGKSVFAFMKLNSDKKFFVDVGAGYFVRKNVDETKMVAKDQKQRLEMFKTQLSNEIQNITSSLRELIETHNS
ncbi:prefoldin subunit alpha [Candidatus Pacearchaeota archaeon]|nr:prefoldin subunit alpha [Candidatus Pacearchaeota archaeon]